jgi:hypothetical protein
MSTNSGGWSGSSTLDLSKRRSHNLGVSPVPHEIVQAFAIAVAAYGERRGARLLPNNSTADWLDIPTLSRRGDPFVVVYAKEFLVFDADLPSAPESAEILSEQAEALGLQALIWASGREGHRQVVIRAIVPAHRERLISLGKTFGMQHRTRSRPPLSPHRHGLPVSLVHPAGIAEALAVLQRAPEAPQGEFTPRTWQRIRFGDSEASSGSEEVFRIAMGAAVKGWTADRLYGLLMRPANRGGDALRRRAAERGEAAARRWLVREVWPRAVEFITRNPPIGDPTDARLLLVEMTEEIPTHPWPVVDLGAHRGGKGPRVRGTSVRQGLNGLIELGLEAGRLDLTVSDRMLTWYAGFGSRTTATKVLKALEHLGWINQTWKGKGRRSSTYRLLPNRARRNGPYEHPIGGV